MSPLKKAATVTAHSALQGQWLSHLIFEQRGRSALISLVKMSPFLIAVLHMVVAISARLWWWSCVHSLWRISQQGLSSHHKSPGYTSLVTLSQCFVTHWVNNNCLIGTFIFSYLFDSSHRSQAQGLLSSCSHTPAVTSFTWRGLLPLAVSPSCHLLFSSQEFVSPLSKAHNQETVLSDSCKIREGFMLPQSTCSDLGPSDKAPVKQLQAQKRSRCLK